MEFPSTIRTSVSQQAITKVTRLFNGTVGDVLNELLQNARRAGATNVAIETLDLAGHPTLAIRDDGIGITDPAVLVSLGRSGWDETIQTREDPAGMGVFSLAGHRVEIRSRARGSATGWRVVIPADAWETSAEIPVEAFSMDEGTEIHIDLPLAWERNLESAAGVAAKFFPLPITLNGRELDREDFLANATSIEIVHGCRIGVFLNRQHRSSDVRINFHGVALPVELPQIEEERGGCNWSVQVDIIDAPDLQLVLPARKEMVVNAALDDLKRACTCAIYHAIAKRPGHRLAFKLWCEARDLGITLPEAANWLECWRPTTADPEARQSGSWINEGPMLLMSDHDADVEQCAAPVLLDAELLGATTVYEQTSYAGYIWYDRIPRIDDLHFMLEFEGARHRYCPDSLDVELPSERVPAISLHFTIVDQAGTDGIGEERSFPISVLICDSGSSWLGDTQVFVTEDATITPSELADLIEAAVFCAGDDADCDSWETQRRDFQAEAFARANTILLGAEAAALARIRAQLHDEIAWLVPDGKILTASVQNRKVALMLTDIVPTA